MQQNLYTKFFVLAFALLPGFVIAAFRPVSDRESVVRASGISGEDLFNALMRNLPNPTSQESLDDQVTWVGQQVDAFLRGEQQSFASEPKLIFLLSKIHSEERRDNPSSRLTPNTLKNLLKGYDGDEEHSPFCGAGGGTLLQMTVNRTLLQLITGEKRFTPRPAPRRAPRRVRRVAPQPPAPPLPDTLFNRMCRLPNNKITGGILLAALGLFLHGGSRWSDTSDEVASAENRVTFWRERLTKELRNKSDIELTALLSAKNSELVALQRNRLHGYLSARKIVKAAEHRLRWARIETLVGVLLGAGGAWKHYRDWV